MTKNSISLKQVRAFVAVLLIGLTTLALSPHRVIAATQRFVCNDGQTLIPLTQGANPTTFCQDKGGYSARQVWLCDDQATIVPPTYRGPNPDDYCRQQDAGGFTQPERLNDAPPVDTDCETDVQANEELTQENCRIIYYLVNGINFLSALAGMAIIASIMIAGYQYMTAGDNSGQIQKAKSRIQWALIALLLFIFMYALLNFLVPGGVL